MNPGRKFFEFLRLYAKAMPAAHRQRYDAFAVADQARIAFDRNDKAINAGTFRSTSDDGTPICVVASDRHMLLSALSRALVLTRADVVAAEAFTLDADSGLDGVIGLFWVRQSTRRQQALSREQRILLIDLLIAFGNRENGRQAVFNASRRARTDGLGTTVRFLEGLDGNLSVLEVETKVRSGLLPTLVDVFVAERLQIVQCEVQATGDRVRDRFRLVEHDGGSIAPSRWLQIQTHVLDAIARTADPIVASA